MELDLQRTVLEGYRPILDTVLSQEETMESIVPDAFPDVSRIIYAGGNAFLTAKQAGEGCAKIMGTACINVLYVPEGEQMPRSLALNLPFQCTGDCPQINGSTQVHGMVLSLSADARLINPRKLFVKAEVKIRLKVYGQDSREMTCDMASDENGIMQKLMMHHKDFSIGAVLEKPFLFSDTLRQSSTKPNMEELLCCRAEPGMVEAKYIGKKLVCKGDVLLTVLYRSGTELIPARFELPFSQILEMEGSFDEGEPDVTVVLKSTDCHLQEAELEVSVEAFIQATLWSHRNITLLSDVYSTAEPLDVERAANSICTMSELSSRRENARKFCESGIPAKQVLSCTVNMGPLSSQRQDSGVQYSTDASMDILYLSEDNALCGVNYLIPISCNVDLAPDYTCSCHCRPVGEVMAVPVTGGFEVRMEAEFCWRTMKMETVSCVASVRRSNVAVKDEQKPSVIIRMVSSGETLWDIAKSCGSTIQDICAANELSSESAVPGELLLIPIKS